MHARFGKGEALAGDDAWIMREISKRGWDDALQNEEAMKTLQNSVQRGWSWLLDKALIVFSTTERINRGSTEFMQRPGKGAFEFGEKRRSFRAGLAANIVIVGFRPFGDGVRCHCLVERFGKLRLDIVWR